MDNNEIEIQGRLEAIARQRNIALDEAVFHAGRVKALQAELESRKEVLASLNEALAQAGEKIRKLEAEATRTLDEIIEG